MFNFKVLVLGAVSCLVLACGGPAQQTTPESASSSAASDKKITPPPAAQPSTVPCHVETTEDGDTVVFSGEGEVGVGLGPGPWETQCSPSGEPLMLASSEGFLVTVMMADLQGEPVPGTYLLEMAVAGMQEGMMEDSNWQKQPSKEKVIGETQIQALCFDGPFDQEGASMHAYACFTQKLSSEGVLFLAGSAYFVMATDWQQHRQDVIDSVDVTSANWFLKEEYME